MPINVIHDLSEAPEKSGAFLLELELWPHQSLTGTGFVWMIGASFAMLCIPMVGLMGTAALWGILPFCMAVLGLLWLSLKRSWRDRDILERLVLTADAAHLIRRDPDGSTRDWQANPYWMRVERHDKVGTIEDYLTLEGGSRAVEIGAFLTPSERRGLERRILRALGRIKG